MKTKFFKQTAISLFVVSALTASSVSMANSFFGQINTIKGADNNSAENVFIQPQDPALSGGGLDQSLQFGDILVGSFFDNLMIGGLGPDVMMGGFSNDVMIGGIEHFNPSNRDRAYGGWGNDIFIWKPGDGSDLFIGGPGHDVVVFGLIGEVVDGNVEFKVVKDQKSGEVAIDPTTYLPLVDVTNSPGFCDVIDDSSSPESKDELAALGLDQLVRFSLRKQANEFESGVQDTDNGLRVTLHLSSVETLVCTNRDGGQIEVFDLTSTPPKLIANGVSAQDLAGYLNKPQLSKRLEQMIF